jgi:regulatory protein
METAKKQKKLTIKEAYLKAAAYCAYQERTQQHVRDKLFSYGLHSDEVEESISKLITDNFINEERYAKAYAGGKFRIKKWGKLKIKASLKFEGLSDYCIKKGLLEIPQSDYETTIKKIITERSKKETEKNSLKRKFKIATYLISRGYENDLVWDQLNSLEK